ncbi:MAG: DUF4340 domain-containing protein [Gammaproteobacteria bacterium]|nr:DUF4340 domain-containing protein [Gammaproteobacteria bacterium]
MSQRTLLALLATLAVLAALAIAVSLSERQVESGTGSLLLPDLKAGLNDIERIVVRTGGEKVVATLVRARDGWTVTEQQDYAADIGRIRKLLLALAEAKILEEKTSNAELYDRLKVEDIALATAGGVEVELAKGSSSTKVIIGRVQGAGERYYVRRSGEKQSWLVKGNLDAAREASGWVDKTITDVATERIQAVRIDFPDGSATQLVRPADGSVGLNLAELPKGRELAWPGVANAIGGALADLSFDAVEPAAKFDPDSAKPITARFETNDGLVIVAETWKLASGERTRFRASGDEKAAAEAERINTRVGAWVYALPDYKLDHFTKRPDDLLAP